VSEELARYRDLCRAKGIPCTRQRLAILEAVLESPDHPTADAVHAIVARRIRSLSRTTVYRVMEELAEMGLIAKASHPGKAVRYDRRTDLHHHLVCLRCNAVVDISNDRLDAVRIPDTTSHGFEVTSFQVQLRGLCRACRRRSPTSGATK
jgi:Fe2+ or Zn2+ uptake regulation protein